MHSHRDIVGYAGRLDAAVADMARLTGANPDAIRRAAIEEARVCRYRSAIDVVEDMRRGAMTFPTSMPPLIQPLIGPLL